MLMTGSAKGWRLEGKTALHRSPGWMAAIPRGKERAGSNADGVGGVVDGDWK